jgi:hypothetical protein
MAMGRTAAWHAEQAARQRREMQALLDASAASRRPASRMYPARTNEATRQQIELSVRREYERNQAHAAALKAQRPAGRGRTIGRAPNPAAVIYPNLPSERKFR